MPQVWPSKKDKRKKKKKKKERAAREKQLVTMSVDFFSSNTLEAGRLIPSAEKKKKKQKTKPCQSKIQ